MVEALLPIGQESSVAGTIIDFLGREVLFECRRQEVATPFNEGEQCVTCLLHGNSADSRQLSWKLLRQLVLVISLHRSRALTIIRSMR